MKQDVEDNPTHTSVICGLVVRVSGYRSRFPRFDSRRFLIFCEAAGPERGLLSLVRRSYLKGKVAAPV
jgi:hypothetical protein